MQVQALHPSPTLGHANDLSYLDQPEFKNQYRLNSNFFDYQLYVEGIHCSSCVHRIEKLPQRDSTVELARVDFGKSTLYLKVKEHFSLARAAEQLAAMGFRAQFVRSSEQTNTLQAQENKIFLKKLAVAGACTGNIMLFVVPIYSGLEGNLKIAFNWMSFLLFLPIVLYSGTIFYSGAWKSLKMRTINIDFPMSVALIGGFLLSTLNLIRNDDNIYFDSTASFIFLILCSRYILKRNQQKYLTSLKLEDVIGNDHYTRLSSTGESEIPMSEIRAQDLIRLRAGQLCPTDGILESGSRDIDVSILNGEPMPRTFEKGMNVLAGVKILSSQTVVRATATPTASHLARTLQELHEGLIRKSRFTTLTDRCAQILILVVFTLAIGVFTFYFGTNPQEAFNRSLALIVLACPCALALGAPLAMALALKKAQAKGILVKNNDAFEKILKVQNIFFDKTGTLTHMDLSLKNSTPAVISSELKTIIISLEQKSFHPIAFALRKAWPGVVATPIENLQEISNKGIQGQFDSHIYELSEDPNQTHSDDLTVQLKKDGEKICTLSFENSLRTEAKECVEKLILNKKNCFILSGDSTHRAQTIAMTCGLPTDQVFSHLSATEKRLFVQRSSNTCMIGDGTNDALALQAADVGIAVKGSTHLNLQAADVCFTNEGLTPLIDFFEVAQKAKKVLIRNLSFSLMYNLIGGTLALTGYINPWMAAILMPISSFLILLSTLWGLR